MGGIRGGRRGDCLESFPPPPTHLTHPEASLAQPPVRKKAFFLSYGGRAPAWGIRTSGIYC